MEEIGIERKEALQKIKAHISVANICMLTNNILGWPLQNESLNNQWLDENGCIWFLSFRQNGNDQEYLNGKMEVFYSNRSDAKFLSLVGFAREASWSETNSLANFPFKHSGNSAVSTPIRLVKFFPEEAFYWDEPLKEMVPLFLYQDVQKQSDRVHI